MGTYFFEINGTNWYCLSVFYAKKRWIYLLRCLRKFYNAYELSLDFFYFRFSAIGGERLDVIMTFRVDYIRPEDIETFFRNFIKNNPSRQDFDNEWISHSIWMPYKNDSVEWKKFHMPGFIFKDDATRENLCNLSVVGLYLSELVDDIDSVLLFLLVKLLRYPILYKVDIFSQLHSACSVPFISQLEVLDSYLNYQFQEFLPAYCLSKWENSNEIYCLKKQYEHFWGTYVSLREQYGVIGKPVNEILTCILIEYLHNRIKE